MKTNPGFDLIPASPEHVPAIMELITALAEFERLTHLLEVTPEALHDHLFGQRRAAEVVVALVAGEVVGFALFFSNFSTFLGRPGLYLEDLFVRPERRGLGIGKALLEHLAALALARGCGRFEWSVLDWNEPSLKFYASLGAIPMSEWTEQRLVGAPLHALAGRWQAPLQH